MEGDAPPNSALNAELPPRVRGRAGRSVTLDEAIAAIEDGDRVYVSSTCSVPTALVDAMTEARDRWTRIDLITDYLVEPLSAFEHPGAPFHLMSLQPSAAVGPMREGGALATIPCTYSQFFSMLRPGGPHPVDVALLHVSEPGPDGTFSLGVGVGANIEVLRTAPLVIAQVNPQMPYTFGAGEVERDEIDLLVDVDHPLVELAPPRPDETALTIGQHAASLIDDGSVLQFGIGAIPESVLAALHDRTDLGIHGGMVGDTVIDLVEAGVLTGARKNVDRGKMIVAAVLGTRRSFDWAHRNDAIYTVPSTYSHGATALGRVNRFVGINSALSMASDGSANAETAGSRVLSGPGGQPDFALGASISQSGLSIIAMPSTGAGGTRSRIVPHLPLGTTTTIPRYLIDTVVTEFGIARLRGLPLEQRPAALARIAHPDFRGDLS